MRLLFLDLDGVANCHCWIESAECCGIDQECMANLNRIIHATGARIVISSAWRYILLANDATPRGFGYMLRTHGLTSKAEVIGHTASDEEICRRDMQIEAWLKSAQGVESYVVLDDMREINDLHDQRGRLVLTKSDVGLTEQDAERAIEILNTPFAELSALKGDLRGD